MLTITALTRDDLVDKISMTTIRFLDSPNDDPRRRRSTAETLVACESAIETTQDTDPSVLLTGFIGIIVIMNVFSMDGRCWQDYESEYTMPTALTPTAAAPTPVDMGPASGGPGAEPALILSLDEGSVECR